jgi:glyoxylase-like metal-dependent hydrolase (beta-lactamase superfamily II)
MGTVPALPPTMRFLERDWLSSNNVLFVDADSSALVDSGYVKHREMTVALVRRLLGARPLDRLVNTHLHSDHCGGNRLLQQTFRCRTSIPAASADAVRAWDTVRLSYAATGQRCDRFGFDDVIVDGQTVELGRLRWQAIAAPGHDPDAVVLHCADEGILISADALWQDGFGVIFPELAGESGFAEQQAVLERIAGLDVGLVIPGHGPMFTDLGAALDRAHRRLEHLRSDPGRNARHAVKVMLKFLLLDRGAIPVGDVGGVLASMTLIQAANRAYVGMTDEALAAWAVEALLKAGAARIADGMLLDA